jgi:hypothetical protein
VETAQRGNSELASGLDGRNGKMFKVVTVMQIQFSELRTECCAVIFKFQVFQSVSINLKRSLSVE